MPSITGTERAVAAEIVAIARALRLDAELVEFDLDAMRAAPGYPGEEAPRDELVGAIVTLPGSDPRAPRLALNGHIDVVAPGTEPWQRDPWSGDIDGGRVHGRGALDMKGGVIAALHAMGALQAAGARAARRRRPAGDPVRGGRRPRHLRRAAARRPTSRPP